MEGRVGQILACHGSTLGRGQPVGARTLRSTHWQCPCCGTPWSEAGRQSPVPSPELASRSCALCPGASRSASAEIKRGHTRPSAGVECGAFCAQNPGALGSHPASWQNPVPRSLELSPPRGSQDGRGSHLVLEAAEYYSTPTLSEI